MLAKFKSLIRTTLLTFIYFLVCCIYSHSSLAILSSIDQNSQWHVLKAIERFEGFYRPISATTNYSYIKSPDEILLDGTVLHKVSAKILDGFPTLVVEFTDWKGQPLVKRKTLLYNNHTYVVSQGFLRLTEVSNFTTTEDSLTVTITKSEQLFSLYALFPIWPIQPVKKIVLEFFILDGKKNLIISTFDAKGLLVKKISEHPYRTENLCETVLKL